MFLKLSIIPLERNGKKIGYVSYLRGMIWGHQQMLEQELIEGSLKDADGIVELRDGCKRGPIYLNIFLPLRRVRFPAYSSAIARESQAQSSNGACQR